MDSTDPLRILKIICGTSLLITVGLLTYSTFARSTQKEKVTVSIGGAAKKDVEPSATKAQANFPGEDKTIKARLVSKRYISPDTVKLDFEFIDKKGFVPVGKHVKIFANNRAGCVSGHWNGNPDHDCGKDIIERKYTPTSSTEEGFTLVIKAYRPNEKFVDGGKMSQSLADLNTSDTVSVALPFGIMEYLRMGKFRRSKQIVDAKFVGMLAGGSGITPMYRLICAALADDEDKTKFALIFANRSEVDILLRNELEALAKKHPDRFKVAYTLTRPPPNWSGETGLITKETIRAYMPPPGGDTLILCCGPPAMIKTCCKDNLEALGYNAAQVWDF